jgi:hypothetical protein
VPPPWRDQCSYTFPIAARSAVCGFSAEVEGRKITGEVKENEEAAVRLKSHTHTRTPPHTHHRTRTRTTAHARVTHILLCVAHQNLYDDAISSGHGAFTGRSEKPNVFTAVVGNLPPGTTPLPTYPAPSIHAD